MMTDGTTRSDLARRAIEELTGLPAVAINVDGQGLVAAFAPDAGEHQRRSAVGVGAVTSRALLHGLWLLPAGVSVPTQALPEPKRKRLQRANGFACEDDASFHRLYSPAGTVKVIGIAGADCRRSVMHAIRFTPIVQRVAVADASSRPSPATLDLAGQFGVGVLAAHSDRYTVLRQPAPAVVGVPAVYRWWLAELAYEGWLQHSAQPVS